jgi:hypothetical protein
MHLGWTEIAVIAAVAAVAIAVVVQMSRGSA